MKRAHVKDHSTTTTCCLSFYDIFSLHLVLCFKWTESRDCLLNATVKKRNISVIMSILHQVSAPAHSLASPLMMTVCLTSGSLLSGMAIEHLYWPASSGRAAPMVRTEPVGVFSALARSRQLSSGMIRSIAIIVLSWSILCHRIITLSATKEDIIAKRVKRFSNSATKRGYYSKESQEIFKLCLLCYFRRRKKPDFFVLKAVFRSRNYLLSAPFRLHLCP